MQRIGQRKQRRASVKRAKNTVQAWMSTRPNNSGLEKINDIGLSNKRLSGFKKYFCFKNCTFRN